MIIAYNGPIGCGKGTASSLTMKISNNNAEIISFADPMREFMLKIYGLNYVKGSDDFNKTHDRELKQHKVSEVFPQARLSSLASHIRDTFSQFNINARHLQYKLYDILLGDYTVRETLQLIGTEFGRNEVKDTVWIDLMKTKVDKILTEGKTVIIDDCRFPNEAESVNTWGGYVIRLNRDCGESVGISGHISEQPLPDSLVSLSIDNRYSIEVLEADIRQSLHLLEFVEISKGF